LNKLSIAERLRHRRLLKIRNRRKDSQKARGKKNHAISKLAPLVIPLPEQFSFDLNPARITDVINRFNHKAFVEKRDVYFDFKPLIDIGPAAALVLAAEIDRWRKTNGSSGKLVAKHLKHWERRVLVRLVRLGLFDLLEVVNKPSKSICRDDVDKLHMARFRTGRLVEAQKYKEIHDELCEFGFDLSIANKPLMASVSEALTNVTQHAYDSLGEYRYRSSVPFLKNQWWMSASYDEENGYFELFIYDQGVTIPASLREKSLRQIIKKIQGFDTDADLIERATQGGVSVTKQKHRGFGLQEMRRFVEEDKMPNSLLRIISGGGILEIKANGMAKKSPLQPKLNGTLLHWRVGATK